MDKTIKQIADEIGVSKQAIRNEIDKQGLQSSLRKKGNQFLINKKQERQIKQAFEHRKLHTENVKQVQTDLQLYEILKSELDNKNKQIKELQEQNRQQADVIAKLADQAQQLQLAQIAQKSENETQLITTTVEQKKGFFKHLFKKSF